MAVPPTPAQVRRRPRPRSPIIHVRDSEPTRKGRARVHGSTSGRAGRAADIVVEIGKYCRRQEMTEHAPDAPTSTSTSASGSAATFDEPFVAAVTYQDTRAALAWLARAFGFELSMLIEGAE